MVAFMMKVLIVDDEQIERKGIRSLLESFNKKFEFEEAINGKDAVRKLENTYYDILITDIKMPLMNGIELTQYAKKVYPDIEVIIFSGYGEFEYAKQAMKYGVTNYVLKPVDIDEFIKTMQELLQKLELKKERDSMLQESQTNQNKYFLGKYLYSGSHEMLEKIKDRIDIREWEHIRAMFLIEGEKNFFGEKEDEFIEIVRKGGQRKLDFLNLNQNQELCFVKDKYDYRELALDIYKTVSKIFGISFYIAVSNPISQTEEMPKTFEKLDTLIENRFYRKQERIFYETEKTGCLSSEKDLCEIIRKMTEDIRLADILHIQNHFIEMRNGICQGIVYSQIYTKFMFSSLAKEFYECGYIEESTLESEIRRIYECKTIDEILPLVEKMIQKMENRILDNRRNARSDIAQAKSYIFEYYSKDISVETLAELVYLSPEYFSYIFKKETGVNPNRFICEYRIKKAKELLLTTNMKVAQICFATGFTNVSYFCKKFREYCGCSPEQFRHGETMDESFETEI